MPSPIGFDELHMQMKITNRLLATQLKDKMSQPELVVLLATTGASDSEIAAVVGTSAGTVKVTRYRARGKQAKGTKSRL